MKIFQGEEYLDAEEVSALILANDLKPMPATDVDRMLNELDWPETELNPPPARLRNNHGHRFWNKRLIEILIATLKDVERS